MKIEGAAVLVTGPNRGSQSISSAQNVKPELQGDQNLIHPRIYEQFASAAA